jgi:hypothetical protein
MDVAELRPGLWRWTAPHPRWSPGAAWPRAVGCVYAELRDSLVLIDPLVPAEPEAAARFWGALDGDRRRLADHNVEVLLTAAWHRRSADAVAERYDAAVRLPGEAVPEGAEKEVFEAGEWREAVVALPDFEAVVFGDVIQGDGRGGLEMPPDWWPPEDPRTVQIRTELRHVLRWPLEIVLVSHGEPILEGGRAALAQALEM